MNDNKEIHWIGVLFSALLGGVTQYAIQSGHAGFAVAATVFLFIMGGVTQPEDKP